MAVAIIMPRQGQSVESCIITEWHKRVGDVVDEGDRLFTYETDKAVFEEEAKASGILLARFFEEDDDVPVLTNVAVIGNAGERFDEFAPGESSQYSAPEQPSQEHAEAQSNPLTASDTPNTGIADFANDMKQAKPVSPRAKATAKRMGVDPMLATPTGPHGRVIERDVDAYEQHLSAAREVHKHEAALEEQQDAAREVANTYERNNEYTDQKLSNMRKAIAKSMQTSLSTTAQLTNSTSFDATSILAYRKQLKAAMETSGIPNITLNDMVLYAVSRVLPNHPDLNAHLLDGTTMRRFEHVHLGMAVDTPRGLLVPTILNADMKSLGQIAIESKQLAQQAQQGSINPDLLSGASFTISNLGSFGIESFTPVINPPQTGILGVNAIIEKVRTVNGEISTYKSMGLSLTYDHRAVDGAPASKFLRDLCQALEHFVTLLI